MYQRYRLTLNPIFMVGHPVRVYNVYYKIHSKPQLEPQNCNNKARGYAKNGTMHTALDKDHVLKHAVVSVSTNWVHIMCMLCVLPCQDMGLKAFLYLL